MRFLIDNSLFADNRSLLLKEVFENENDFTLIDKNGINVRITYYTTLKRWNNASGYREMENKEEPGEIHTQTCMEILIIEIQSNENRI